MRSHRCGRTLGIRSETASDCLRFPLHLKPQLNIPYRSKICSGRGKFRRNTHRTLQELYQDLSRPYPEGMSCAARVWWMTSCCNDLELRAFSPQSSPEGGLQFGALGQPRSQWWLSRWWRHRSKFPKLEKLPGLHQSLKEIKELVVFTGLSTQTTAAEVEMPLFRLILLHYFAHSCEQFFSQMKHIK